MKKFPIYIIAMGAFAMTSCGNANEGAKAASGAENATPDDVTTVASAETGQSGSSDGADYEVAPSGEYSLDKSHGYIVFSYDHQGFSSPHLRWRDWNASLDWDNENPGASSISVIINAESVDSGVDEFDGHLKSADFFDVASHPEITFDSTSLTKSSDTEGTMTGDLTIKGQTHPVTLNVTFNKADFNGRDSEYKIGFSAKGEINRSQWGLDLYVPFISDEVNLIIETEFTMPSGADE